jgi:large conductance mechanosensitive channel
MAASDTVTKEARTVIAGFKKFLMRGNVVDLAVAVVMGAAFGAVVTALVNDMIMPLITAIFGKQNYDNLTFTLNKSVFKYGNLISALISFVAIAAVVYFLIVSPLNHLAERRRRRTGAPEDEPVETEKELLAQIRDLLAAERSN